MENILTVEHFRTDRRLRKWRGVSSPGKTTWRYTELESIPWWVLSLINSVDSHTFPTNQTLSGSRDISYEVVKASFRNKYNFTIKSWTLTIREAGKDTRLKTWNAGAAPPLWLTSFEEVICRLWAPASSSEVWALGCVLRALPVPTVYELMIKSIEEPLVVPAGWQEWRLGSRQGFLTGPLWLCDIVRSQQAQ